LAVGKEKILKSMAKTICAEVVKCQIKDLTPNPLSKMERGRGEVSYGQG
jgi:hypothetical protein